LVGQAVDKKSNVPTAVRGQAHIVVSLMMHPLMIGFIISLISIDNDAGAAEGV